MAEEGTGWLGKAQAIAPFAEAGLKIGKEFFNQHLRDKYIKPARNRYLETLHSNEGYSGYSKAQTDSMRRARDLARGTIAAAQGHTMATGASLGQRMHEMSQVGENANSTDFYDLNTSLQNNENRGRQSQVGVAEGNAGRLAESANQITDIVGRAGKTLLGLAGLKNAEGGDDASTPTMDPGSNKANTSANVQLNAFNDDVKNRIRTGTASDEDMRAGFDAGYMGGPKTQAYYKSQGWM